MPGCVILDLSMGMDFTGKSNRDLIIDFAYVAGVIFALLYYSVILIVIHFVVVINYRPYKCHLQFMFILSMVLPRYTYIIIFYYLCTINTLQSVTITNAEKRWV